MKVFCIAVWSFALLSPWTSVLRHSHVVRSVNKTTNIVSWKMLWNCCHWQYQSKSRVFLKTKRFSLKKETLTSSKEEGTKPRSLEVNEIIIILIKTTTWVFSRCNFATDVMIDVSKPCMERLMWSFWKEMCVKLHSQHKQKKKEAELFIWRWISWWKFYRRVWVSFWCRCACMWWILCVFMCMCILQ